MLALTDPLWKKLDDAHRDRSIPKLLAGLAEEWNDETANSLFWDCLCHQETCYGATYAVIPHLLKIAQPPENRHQRLEIGLFLGFVVLCALDPQRASSDDLQGLPRTADEWDRKLDCYRQLLANIEFAGRLASRYERDVERPRYKEILAIGPVNGRDLEKIESIRGDFFSALPAIRALCERVLLENLQDPDAIPYVLSGVAATDGLLDLAFLLSCGAEGHFRCSSCDWRYQYILFGDRVAIYADEDTPGAEDRGLQDYKERAPSRADGFIVPAKNSGAPDSRVTALLALADGAPNAKPGLLLRNFLGTFLCRRCGTLRSICKA
jgi:hypothetical protein